ncbi:MAG TPA: diguanylate cyclase [Burkholderiales bacterium]|nr:diguanylate cyclase [Burkholderiales bacterium]
MVTASDILNAPILVVDDQHANVEILEFILRDGGYARVDSTRNPREVGDLHRRNRYSLILLDLLMPGMDGFQVMDTLKGIEQRAQGYLPVLVITAYPDHKLRALQSGARDFISKPFDVYEVLMRVRNLLEVRLLHESERNNNRMLEALALHDPLTGLANRRLLGDRILTALAQVRRSKGCMAVMYLDLDGFKQVNDTLGHGAGDMLLKIIAARLKQTVREEDTVSRLGGDEFVIALPHIRSAGDAARMARKIIDAVSQPCEIEGKTVSTTASVGVGIYPAHGEDVETLMQSADRALYAAKRAGKNGYRVGGVGDVRRIAAA